MNTKEPTAEDANKLFEAIEDKFPSATVGGDKWYIATVRPDANLMQEWRLIAPQDLSLDWCWRSRVRSRSLQVHHC